MRQKLEPLAIALMTLSALVMLGCIYGFIWSDDGDFIDFLKRVSLTSVVTFVAAVIMGMASCTAETKPEDTDGENKQ